MTQLTNYQLVKLGSNLEFLRGLCTTTLLVPETGMENFPNLVENLPTLRYSVVRVVGVLKAILIQLQEMQLEQSLLAANAFRPMLQEMEDHLQRTDATTASYLFNPFAERLVTVAKQVASAVRSELSEITDPANAASRDDAN